MKPLSRRRRSLYLILCILVFVVLVPLTLLYSSGYRLGEHFALVKTGGIYIGSNQPGAELYLNNEFVRGVGILKQGFFVQDLSPGMYTVTVKKEGHYSWEKVLKVQPQLVVEASAFMLPQEMILTPIPEFLQEGQTATRTATRRILNPSYAEATALFATTTTAASANQNILLAGTKTASSTARVIEGLKKKGDIVLWKEKNIVLATWVGNNSQAPLYFCGEEHLCNREIPVYAQGARFFDFYPNGNELVILAIDNGVFVAEIDDRSVRNIQPMYEKPGAEFRIDDDVLFIRDGKLIFSVEL